MALARFLTKQLEKMDKSAKKMAGSPGYDEDTLAAQKEYIKEQKIEKSKKLSKEEEMAADREAYNAAMGISKKDSKKGPLTEKEKKQLQEEINMYKGGSVKKKVKMAMGGAVRAASNAAKAAVAASQAPKAGVFGGITKAVSNATSKATLGRSKQPTKMAKGGMANCGASMKPAQKAKK